MEIVYTGDRNARNRALLVSNDEWKRLGKILTKKTDYEDAAEAATRLKETRREMSKRMVDGWDNTELNKTKKLLEQKRTALSELEAKRRQRDEEMKHEAVQARNAIIEKARRLKFEERDSTKTFNRALRQSEVFKERAIQMRSNELERVKKMEKDLMTAQQLNNETDQYRKDKMDEKRKNDEFKRAKAETLLTELEDRENKRRDEEIASFECRKAELQKIAEEIDEIQEKAKAEARAAKERLQKDIEENRQMIAKNDKMRQMEERDEELVNVIMAETIKNLARMRRLKEKELMEVKQQALEEMRMRVAAKPTKEKGWAQTDVENFVEAQEQRYREDQRAKREAAKKRMEYIESGKKIWKDENAKRRERSALVSLRDAERRKREERLLSEFAELRRANRIANMSHFRKQLDKQCYDKIAAEMADRQADVERRDKFERQWHEEDEQFIEYTRQEIEKKKFSGNPIAPLLKTVKNYLEENELCIDQNNKVSKKTAKGPVYTSRIIPQPNSMKKL